jgi:trk system potassium uptake protein TrkH
MLLMFVGASPGLTGGGIKTTTAFAIAASVFALVFRHEPVAFKRKLGNESLLKAFHVLVLASSVVVAALFLLLWIEHERFTFLQVAFEAVSAFATVGLSTGITPSLQDPSKLVLVVVMFIGRVGPITVATALKGKESSVKHVEERIIIG